MEKSGLIFFFCIFFFLGCTKDKMKGLADDEYLFVEFFRNQSGRVLEGNLDSPIGLLWCCPTYVFEKSTGKLLGNLNFFDVNKDLKVIYGSNSTSNHVMGSSHGSTLWGFYNLPTEDNRLISTNLIIDYLADSDMVYFSMDSIAPVMLKVNERKDFIMSVDTLRFLDNVGGGEIVVEITETWSIVNNGILKKDMVIHKNW